MSWHAGGSGGAGTGGRGERIRGRVKDWNAEKGFGFIHTLDADYFCHHSAVQGEGYKSLRDNEEVEFEVETNPANGKLQVVNLTGPGGAPVKGGDRPAGKGKGRGWGKGKSEDGADGSGGGGRGRGESWGSRGRGGGRGGQRQGPKPNSVFVAGLSWATTEEGFREHFEQLGEVVDAYIVKDRETGKSRGFGKVAFATAAEQERAIEALHESDLDGRTITVREDNPPPPREDGAVGWSPTGATSWNQSASPVADGSASTSAGGGLGAPASSWAGAAWPAAALAEPAEASPDELRPPEEESLEAGGERAISRDDPSGEREEALVDGAPASSPVFADSQEPQEENLEAGGEVASSAPATGASGWSSGEWSQGWGGSGGGWGSSNWGAQGSSWGAAWAGSGGAEGAEAAEPVEDSNASGGAAQS